MREYILPTIEIIPTGVYVMQSGSDIHETPGGGEEFTNTTTFEQDIVTPDNNLWEEKD